MATESPLRMLDSGGTRKKPSPKDTAVYRPTVQNKEAEELGVLLKGHRFHVDQKDAIPDRSGSAPPSIEGSVAAFRNILAQTNLSSISSLENLNFESEEHMRSDPAYSAYYSSNVNLNPRLPKPLISRENPRLVHQIGSFGNNWKSASLDDSGNKPSQFSRGSLSTHKEEPEDDRSPREASEAENGTLIDSEQNISSLSGRHKSLVDLIQEDFPRTPSPVYSQSRSSSHAADEAIDHDVHSISSNVSAINISKLPESDSASSDVCVDTYGLEESAMRLISNNDPSTASSRDSPVLDGAQNLQKDESRANDSGSDADAAAKGSLQSRTKNKQEDQQCQGRNLVNVLQYHPSPQGIPHPVQGIQAQMIPQGAQGVNQPHSSVGKISHPHPKVSLEVQTPMHPPAHNPTLYASPAYMTAGASFYPNYQPSGLYSPQYSVGGYAYGSAFLPPYVTSYQSQGVPVPFGASPGLSFDGRAAGASAGENIPHAAGLQHLGKFYGQHGLMLQPSFVDPLPMQYFQHPFGDAYGASVQQQIDSFSPQKDPAIAAYIGDQKLQPPTNGGMGISSPGKVGLAAGGYYGGPPSMGMMTQFPPSPLASPVVPSSPVAGINHLVQRNDMRSPQGLSRNAGPYSGGQGQRGANSFDDPKRQYFLEELKSNNARKFELSDIAGRIVEFSVDQHGSRFIQQKLEHCSIEEKVAVFKEVLPHAPKLMTDVFGNYVIQKFFEHGSPEQRKELAGKLAGQMLVLSLQMYGCRVVQKALDVIELEQKIRLVQELDGHVMRCVRDQNGNHVIQKCIECVPTENIEFIISAFRDQVASLSTHPYGCRVIQRVLEHCSDDVQSQCIVDEILESAYLLAQDQYGNYVTQHVLERGKPSERSQIISKLTGKIVQLSQHKYASNVVEKCLEHGDTAEREMLIEEIIGQSEDNDNLLMMMKDQFANYVVQKILETCTEKQQQILLGRIRAHINALKKYTYGKHIVARFEQLCGEESQASES